jgi:hypothetical protein
MDTNWIEAVMRTNTAIVAAEDRFNTQVALALTALIEGQDTTTAQARITICGQRLGWLRRVQAELLQDTREQA